MHKKWHVTCGAWYVILGTWYVIRDMIRNMWWCGVGAVSGAASPRASRCLQGPVCSGFFLHLSTNMKLYMIGPRASSHGVCQR